jgi:hypothetical protein
VSTYHYHHPYDYYYSQPSFFVGGGYSSAFWWMMSEWSAERRAQWFYHNQNNIERDAYERGIKDAEVAKHLAEIKAKNVSVDPDYVDPEFAKDPSLMYDDAYIEAVYNPEVENTNGTVGAVALAVLCIVLGVIGLYAFYWLIFVKKWGV